MGLVVYRVEDLMEMLKVTRRTIYNYIDNGDLEGRKIAGKWIFTEEQVRDFIEGKNVNK